MKTLILTILILASTASLSKAQSQEANIALKPVYDSYFALKDALVKSDGNAAQAVAESLYKNIDNIPMDKLGNNHMMWMKYQSKLKFDAEHMKGTNNIDHHREHFITLSKNMYEVMKVVKYGKTVYYMHCPMYNQKKGGADWLSLDKVIKNPYFGSKMMNCGSISETIE